MATTPFDKWDGIHLCCSGSFRLEQAIIQKHPSAQIYSNDVALWSSAIGALAAGAPIALTFRDRLSFVEDLLGPDATPKNRVAAIVVAQELSRFSGKNDYAQSHFKYFETEFLRLHREALAKVDLLMAKLPIAGYFSGDWVAHVDEAIAKGRGIAAFPPFFKGDYESQYKFLEANVEWDAPTYDLYNPDWLSGIVDKIEESGVPYCILTDQVLEGRKPTIEYVQGRKSPHYCYGSSPETSIRHIFNKPKPFTYTPIDCSKITKESTCTIVPADAGNLNYIKDMYLGKGIIHTTGMANYFVLIDGMLVGGIIYSLSKFASKGYDSREILYLLSDVVLKSEGRLSKLVAMLAASREVVRPVERKLTQKIRFVITTARSQKPVSMKYRGIYEKLSVREADPPETGLIIQYGSTIRDQSIQEVYEEWYVKHHVPAQNKSKARNESLSNQSA